MKCSKSPRLCWLMVCFISACDPKAVEAGRAILEARKQAELAARQPKPEKIVRVVLLRLSQQTRDAVEDAFGLFHPKDKFSWQIEHADKLPDTGWDIVVSCAPWTLQKLSAQRDLAALPREIWLRVPPSLRDPEVKWTAIIGVARVLLYNTRRIRAPELPPSLEEFAEPDWWGRLAFAPASRSFKRLVQAIILARGLDTAQTRLTQLFRWQQQFQTEREAGLAVLRGEADVGLVNHTVLPELEAEFESRLPIRNHFFRNQDAESLVIPCGVGIALASEVSREAETVIRFLQSDQAMNVLATQTNYLALSTGTPLSFEVNIEYLQPPKLSWSDLASIEESEELIQNTSTEQPP